jgi:hypothetical protein
MGKKKQKIQNKKISFPCIFVSRADWPNEVVASLLTEQINWNVMSDLLIHSFVH